VEVLLDARPVVQVRLRTVRQFQLPLALVFISPAVALNNSAVALDQRAICVQPAGQPANHGAKAFELLFLE
jgi:hypothetical protein